MRREPKVMVSHTPALLRDQWSGREIARALGSPVGVGGKARSCPRITWGQILSGDVAFRPEPTRVKSEVITVHPVLGQPQPGASRSRKATGMSKTDRTRPWWVGMADAPMATCVPEHDHRWGPCTLPDEITADSACDGYRTSGCYWRATDYWKYDCGGVSGGPERTFFCRQERRRSRHQARRELRAYHGEE